MFRRLAITGPEHATTANPFLPDGGDGDGGQGGAGGAPQTGGTPPPQQQQGGDSNNGQGASGDGGEPTDWKQHARTWEKRAKDNQAALDAAKAENDRLKAAAMTEAEKAVADAKAEGERAGRLAAAHEAVAARLEGALSHLPEQQRDALINTVSTDRFLKDGAVDRDAIKAWAEAVAPKQQQGGTPLPQGRTPAPPPPSDMNALIRRAAGL